MVIALATKPGINGANTLSIPKEWDATWFRKFIANSLKGADVRNAVGANGISVMGTIASPYATIGFAAPVTLPGPVTINAPTSGDSLFINVNPGEGIKVNNVAGGSGGTYLSWRSAGVEVGFLGNGTSIGGANANDFGIGSDSGSVILHGALGVKGFGPTANALVDMTPDVGTFTGTITGCTTSPTGTVVWARMGNIVTLFLTAILGTSNTTSLTMTGLPAVIQPTRAQNVLCLVQDNGTNVVGMAQVGASGTVIFFRDILATGVVSTTGFTAAGSKGTDNATVTYLLN